MTDGGNDENSDGDCADHHDNDENGDIHDDADDRKYKDYVYRKMLVQEYLKKWRIFKRVKPKNDMMYHDIYNCICQNTKK